MNPQEAFNDLGIDAMTGVRLMGALGLSPIDFNNPARFTRFHQVIDYFKNLPEDTQNFLISKVTTGKIGDKLDKVFEYTQLLDRKHSLERDLESIKKESSITPLDASPIIRESLATKELSALSSLQSISNDIAIYEK